MCPNPAHELTIAQVTEITPALVEAIARRCIRALSTVARYRLTQGERKCLTKVKIGEGEEQALNMDLWGERICLASARALQAPASWCSEELGVISIKPSQSPLLKHFCDGTDGTRLATLDFAHGNYGTLFATYGHPTPTFGDWLVSGMLIAPRSEIFLAVKEDGAFRIELNAQGRESSRKKLELAKDVTIDHESKVCVDSFWPGTARDIAHPLRHRLRPCVGSSIDSYRQLLTGDVIAVVETTRGTKPNLEFAAFVALWLAMGGVAVTLDGTSIEGQLVEFGSADNLIPVIFAPNQQIAGAIGAEILCGKAKAEKFAREKLNWLSDRPVNKPITVDEVRRLEALLAA